MKKNKSLIIVLLIAGYAILTAVYLTTQPAGHIIAQLILAAAAGAIGLYAGTQRKADADNDNKSIIDTLTGLHAYNYFVDRLNEERKRADRFGSRVSMILVEIDDFQNFSDEHGPRVGKDLIKQIGEIVKIQVRGVDIVSRYNEHQFGVLLPNTGRVATHEVAERMRQAVQQSDLGAAGRPGTRTITAGLATYPDNAGDDVQLMERVEEALADGKARGENFVVVFDSENVEKKAAT